MKKHFLIAALLAATAAHAQTPQGEVKGRAVAHTVESAKAVIAGAAVVLPAGIAGKVPFAGAFRDVPAEARGSVPVVVFLHGSSGLRLAAIAEWQQWLATLGIASIAPDSFGLRDRLTYTSPVGKDVYEKIHALRASEIGLAVEALKGTSWADTRRMVLAGTSEGAPAVARYGGEGFLGKIIFAWSCEDNYFVQSHQTSTNREMPVLNIISTTDPFFSAANAWIGNPSPKGHCGPALKSNTRASIVLIPDAPHTLINLPAARLAVAGFLMELLPRQ